MGDLRKKTAQFDIFRLGGFDFYQVINKLPRSRADEVLRKKQRRNEAELRGIKP